MAVYDAADYDQRVLEARQRSLHAASDPIHVRQAQAQALFDKEPPPGIVKTLLSAPIEADALDAFLSAVDGLAQSDDQLDYDRPALADVAAERVTRPDRLVDATAPTLLHVYRGGCIYGSLAFDTPRSRPLDIARLTELTREDVVRHTKKAQTERLLMRRRSPSASL